MLPTKTTYLLEVIGDNLGPRPEFCVFADTWVNFAALKKYNGSRFSYRVIKRSCTPGYDPRYTQYAKEEQIGIVFTDYNEFIKYAKVMLALLK